MITGSTTQDSLPCSESEEDVGIFEESNVKSSRKNAKRRTLSTRAGIIIFFNRNFKSKITEYANKYPTTD